MSVDPERCVTCSDEAVVAEVLAVDGVEATVTGGERVALDLVPDVAPGDRVLCHAGIALEKVER